MAIWKSFQAAADRIKKATNPREIFMGLKMTIDEEFITPDKIHVIGEKIDPILKKILAQFSIDLIGELKGAGIPQAKEIKEKVDNFVENALEQIKNSL